MQRGWKVLSMVLAMSPLAAVAATQPEVQRPPATAQAVGALHTVRQIPEVCTRIEGRFTGQAAAPGVLGLVQPQCLQAFVQAFQWQLARCRWRSTPEAGVLLVEQVQGRTDAGFTRQPRDQRPQAMVQHRG